MLLPQRDHLTSAGAFIIYGVGGSRDFIGFGLFAVNVNLRKGGTEVMSLVAAFDLPLSRLFRGHHDPAGACERTDRSQVTTLRDVLSHAPHLKLKIRIVFRQKPVIDDMTAFIFKAVVIRVVLIIGKSHQPVKFTMIHFFKNNIFRSILK